MSLRALTTTALLAGLLAAPATAQKKGAVAPRTDFDATAKVVRVVGGGPVLQILPGPAVFADSAHGIIMRMPPKMQQHYVKLAEMGPFSNQVAPISGNFIITMTDRGETGDAVSGVAEFRTRDGTNWRVVIDEVASNGNPPWEPHWGGVLTDYVYHGYSMFHSPLMPLLRSDASMWGKAEVYRNGELAHKNAPVHVMITSDTRGDDFQYQCYICTHEPMEQLHLIMPPPEGDKYEAPGGFLHISWEKSRVEHLASPEAESRRGRTSPE